GDWQAPWGDRGRHDEGGDGLPVVQEAVEGLLEVFDRCGVDLDEEAVFAADAMAFGDFGCFFGQGGDLGELPGGRADADEGGDRQAERGGADVRPVAGDDTGSLQPLDALGDGGGRHAYAAGECGHRDPGVAVQFA